MPITYRLFDSDPIANRDSFWQLAYQVIWQLEAGTGDRLRPYLDSNDIPTMGVGFNLRLADVAEQVIVGMGLLPTRIVGGSSFLDRVVAVASGTHANNGALRTALNTLMDEYNRAGPPASRITFAFADLAEATATFRPVGEIQDTGAGGLEERLNAAGGGFTVPYSRERVALLSLKFQGALADPDWAALRAALVAGDRATAWLAIRYLMTNSGDEDKYRKRRGVDPVSWTPHRCIRRSSRWQTGRSGTHRSSGGRWWPWRDPGERRPRCRRSSAHRP